MARVCLAVANESVSYTLLTNLLQLGYQAATAYNAASLLHRLGSERFDVLLLGMSCARISGQSIIDFVKHTYSGTRVILIADDCAVGVSEGYAEALALPLALVALEQALRADDKAV